MAGVVAIGANRDNRRFNLIPVRPDCSDATDLLGYRNKFVPEIIIDAAYDKYGDVYILQNLDIIGTVNMDETTFTFSKKVLDRASTIEFNKVELKYNFEEVELGEISPKNYHNDFLKWSNRDCSLQYQSL